MKPIATIGVVVLIAVLGLLFWYTSHKVVPESASAIQIPVATSTTQVITSTTTTTVVTTKPVVTAPHITSLSPSSGPVETVVTIHGSGFDTTATNQILFGIAGGRHHPDGTADNVIDTVASADGKTLTFTVPASGPSGLLCDADNHCIAISALRRVPGTYPVVVHSKNGTSNSVTFTVTQ